MGLILSSILGPPLYLQKYFCSRYDPMRVYPTLSKYRVNTRFFHLLSMLYLPYSMKYVVLVFIYLAVFGWRVSFAHKDSIAARYLPAIMSAGNDSAKVLAVIRYAEALYSLDKDSAITIMAHSYEQSRKLSFEKGIGTSLFRLAVWEFARDRLVASDSFFNLMLSNLPEGSSWHIPAYAGIAGCFFLQGLPEEAAEYGYKAVRLLDRYEDINISRAYIYNNMSAIWLQLGNSDNVLFYLKKGKEWAEKEKDSVQLGNAWNRMGNYYRAKGDSVRALQSYLEASDIAKAIHDTPLYLITLCNRALFVHDDPDLKKQYYREALSYKQVEDRHRLGLMAPVAGSLYLLGEKKWAAQIWQESISLSRKLKMKVFLREPYQGLAQMYADEGNFREAYRYFKLYVSISDSLFNQDLLRSISILEERTVKTQQKERIAAQELDRIKITHAIADKNRIVYLLGAGGISGFFLVFFYRKNMLRKKELLHRMILLREKETELARYQAALEGKEIERNRIAQELHDGIGSLLSVAKMNASMLTGKEEALMNDPELREVMSLLDNTARSIRTISHNLMPDILLKGGIEEALQLFCKYTSSTNNAAISFQSYGSGVELHSRLEKTIFVILQDIVMHLFHHSAQLDKMDIQFNWLYPSLFVTIETNGILNLDTGSQGDANAEWHMLQNRIYEIGGNMEMQYEEAVGSTVDLEFDLSNDKMMT